MYKITHYANNGQVLNVYEARDYHWLSDNTIKIGDFTLSGGIFVIKRL